MSKVARRARVAITTTVFSILLAGKAVADEHEEDEGGLLSNIGEGFTDGLARSIRSSAEEFVVNIGDWFGGIFEQLFAWVILPPQPYTAARFIDGANIHGDHTGGLEGYTWGCSASSGANPGNYGGMWEVMYCLNETFTEISLTIFGGFLILFMIGLGIGRIDIDNMAESIWNVVLTFIFIVANEEILGLGWAAVYGITQGILVAPVGGGDSAGNIIETFLGGAIGAFGFGQAGVAAGSAAGLSAAGGVSATVGGTTIALSGFWVFIAVFVGILIIIMLTFLLIMFFVQMIAMIGYGLFPFLALLIGAGEIFNKLDGPTKKLTGFFIPPMYSPIMFAVVFKISAAFMLAGDLDVSGSASEIAGALLGVLFYPLFAVGSMMIGAWVVLKQFKAGQMAVGMATTAVTGVAAAGVVGMTSASLSSAFRGAAHRGPKGALAGAAGDAVGGEGGSSLLGPDQDEYDDEEEGYGEDFESNGGGLLDSFGAGPDEEEEEVPDTGRFGIGISRDGEPEEGEEDGMWENEAGFEDGENSDSVVGEEGVGESTSVKGGNERFEEHRDDTLEDIEDGVTTGGEAAEEVAQHQADMRGLEGEERQEFMNAKRNQFANHLDDQNSPFKSANEVQADAFEEFSDNLRNEERASIGNTGLLYGQNYDRKYDPTESDAFNQLKTEDARNANAADPMAGMVEEDGVNHDAEEVFIADSEHGGEASEEMGQFARAMETAEEEEDMLKELGEVETYDDGTIGMVVGEEADLSENELRDVVGEEVWQESKMEDGALKMTPENAQKAVSNFNDEVASSSAEGLRADREASILMDESKRREMRNEQAISARKEPKEGWKSTRLGGALTRATRKDQELASEMEDNAELGITDTGGSGELHSDEVVITDEVNRGGKKAKQLGYRATTNYEGDKSSGVSASVDSDGNFVFEAEEGHEQDLERIASQEGVDAEQIKEDPIGGGSLRVVANGDQAERIVKGSVSGGEAIQANGEAAASLEKTVAGGSSTASIRDWKSVTERQVGGTITQTHADQRRRDSKDFSSRSDGEYAELSETRSAQTVADHAETGEQTVRVPRRQSVSRSFVNRSETVTEPSPEVTEQSERQAPDHIENSKFSAARGDNEIRAPKEDVTRISRDRGVRTPEEFSWGYTFESEGELPNVSVPGVGRMTYEEVEESLTAKDAGRAELSSSIPQFDQPENVRVTTSNVTQEEAAELLVEGQSGQPTQLNPDMESGSVGRESKWEVMVDSGGWNDNQTITSQDARARQEVERPGETPSGREVQSITEEAQRIASGMGGSAVPQEITATVETIVKQNSTALTSGDVEPHELDLPENLFHQHTTEEVEDILTISQDVATTAKKRTVSSETSSNAGNPETNRTTKSTERSTEERSRPNQPDPDYDQITTNTVTGQELTQKILQETDQNFTVDGAPQEVKNVAMDNADVIHNNDDLSPEDIEIREDVTVEKNAIQIADETTDGVDIETKQDVVKHADANLETYKEVAKTNVKNTILDVADDLDLEE